MTVTHGAACFRMDLASHQASPFKAPSPRIRFPWCSRVSSNQSVQAEARGGAGGRARGMGGVGVLLTWVLIGWGEVTCLDWDPVPRKTVKHSGLHGVRRFWADGVWNYSTLMLAEGAGLLYVGAREALFALDLSDITREVKPSIKWPALKKSECAQKGKNNQTECFNYIRFLQSYNRTHLYTCGTYAFQPKCTYIDSTDFSLDSTALEDGKGKCPFDPVKGHTGLIVDKELYSATLNNFLGTEPVILRNLGQHYSMKTEYLPTWLNEPDFVGSSFVRESSGSEIGDDDKIYFFFSERTVGLDCENELTVSRVARVCKGDVGGARTLQKKWTSFQKARLVCSLPERHVTFNTLRAVYTLTAADWRNTAFYAIFHAQWGDVDVSAVCQYQIGDVQRVFDGPFKEYREAAQKWGRYSGQVPTPRPGSCITRWHRENGYNSSLLLPDATLNFAKRHPLMDERAQARPLLLKKGVNFTQLAVDRVAALDQRRYNVLFIGTAEGWLYKAVSLGSDVHVIEEVQLFDTPQPVESLIISHKEKSLYVGSRSQVVQVPLANCGRYSSLPDCLLSRDPYCAWDNEKRACVRTDQHHGPSLKQDIMLESFIRGRAKFDSSPIPSPEHSRTGNVTVVVGSDLVLPCQLVSNVAHAVWLFNDRELVMGGGDDFGVRFDPALRALVIRGVGPAQAGRYVCFSEEQGVKFLTERYQVAVVASAPVFMEARAPDGGMGLFWVLVITLGAACLFLLGVALYLRRRLKLTLGKSAEMKPLESTLVYPISLPKEPPNFIPSKMAGDPDDKFWETGNFYYSDGSLKIVPGHALCSSASSSSPSAIPGQPLHSPSRLSLGNIRGSGSNGYIRLNLGSAGEDRGGGALGSGGGGGGGGGGGATEYISPFKEELRRTLQQRSVLPDANPEESSV
ncbi:semaphorin-4C isoform X2 [Lepisosteus oculatus]|uniref:semaphorin-4C isoform X2 n=1 Tax=Lepisosteus oculatus TaxID=7918 RepID=UPI0035F514D5